MPAVYQGTPLGSGAEPIPNLANPQGCDRRAAAAKLDLLAELNRRHAARRGPSRPSWRPGSPATSWPSGCRPRRPRRSICRKRPTRRATLYGLDDKETASFGRICLLARRLVERGVRFVQLYSRQRQQVGRALGHREEPRRELPLASIKPVAGAAQGPQAPRPARTRRWSSGAASSAARR